MEWEKLLNEQQLQGVFQTQGAVLVVAGAGSGKTRVLTYRIAHLLEQGVSPYHILAITFTNKATTEMRERIETLCPTGAQGLWISTFHAFCARVLRQWIDKLGYTKDYTIYDDVESGRVVKKIIKNKQLDEKMYLNKAVWHISNAKNKGLSPDKYQLVCDDRNADILCQIYERYEEEMKASNALDYDDLLLKTVTLFGSYPDILELYARRFEYIHIDEYQDTNKMQYLLVRMLASCHGNIFAVGDEDQSIYGWRGADINNILDFRKDFPNGVVIKLEQNYRSTGHILEAANALIGFNKGRFGKKLWTAAGSGEPVTFERKLSDGEEADYVVRQIATMMQDGYKPSDFAILVRLNALTNKFEERLNAYNVPYKVFGGFKFFERKEIKDVLAYCRLLVNPKDSEAVLRVINTPKRGIGDTVVGQLVDYCARRGLSVGDVVLGAMEQIPEFNAAMVKKLAVFRSLYYDLYAYWQTAGIADTVKYIVNHAGFALMYAGEDEENYNKRLNIDELVQGVVEFEKDNPTANLGDYLQSVTLSSDTDDIQEDNFVSLATVHAVKGLEFPVVFVVGLEENIFPSGAISKTDVEIEEERRVMYVAMTRARTKLFLTCSATRFRFGHYEQNAESRFLTEIKTKLGIAAPKPAAKTVYAGPAQWGGSQNYGQEAAYTQRYTAQYTTGNVRKQALEVKVGDKVQHAKFGKGMIIGVEGDNATIAFDSVGIKKFNLKIAPLTIIK